jgi:hypothetical protein
MKALINSAQFFTIYEVENETITLLIGKEGNILALSCFLLTSSTIHIEDACGIDVGKLVDKD